MTASPASGRAAVSERPMLQWSEADLLSLQKWQEALLGDLVAIRGDVEHPAGIRAVQARLGEELARLGFADVRREEIHLEARSAPAPVTLGWIAHADTVVLPEARAELTIEGEHLRGHGVADCRGGCVVMLGALKLLVEAGLLGIEQAAHVFSCGDEEIGSPSGRAAIEATVDYRAALVFEPARAGGEIVTGRKGQIVADIALRGVAAHAANDPSAGASAITALAALIGDAEAAAGAHESLTLNVRQISGGVAFNIVPAEASAVIDIRYWEESSADALLAWLGSWRPADERVSVVVALRFRRPAWRTAADSPLLQSYLAAAAAAGWRPGEAMVGGGSDANWLAAKNVAVLDGLGAAGGGYHATTEFIARRSLSERAAAAAAAASDWCRRPEAATSSSRR